MGPTRSFTREGQLSGKGNRNKIRKHKQTKKKPKKNKKKTQKHRSHRPWNKWQPQPPRRKRNRSPREPKVKYQQTNPNATNNPKGQGKKTLTSGGQKPQSAKKQQPSTITKKKKNIQHAEGPAHRKLTPRAVTNNKCQTLATKATQHCTEPKRATHQEPSLHLSHYMNSQDNNNNNNQKKKNNHN